MSLDGESFMMTHTAISRRDNGVVKFPDGGAWDKYFGIDSCNERKNINATNATAMNCFEAEGCDLDVLFGAFCPRLYPVR